MRVSIVICTLNRAESLGAVLDCLRHQHHGDFEVIVVNGPSADATLDVLAPWRERIRYFDNPQRNLSVSRNIGIRAAAGDLVAFIDDDALPEPEWLTQALPAFEDPEVAGAGGIVFDHTGLRLQYRFSATDRLCRPVWGEHEFAHHCFPGTFQFPYLQGTNQIYRRDRLLEAGGFDENIFFYGDDADICARFIDAGWVIRQLPTSPVHHKFLASGIRDHQRITTDLFPVVHDHTYFAVRHASPYLPLDDILHDVHNFIDEHIAGIVLHEEAGRLPEGVSVRTEATCLRGFADALPVGLERVGRPLPQLVADDVEFMRFRTLTTDARRKIVLVSSSYTGNLTGGIGRFMSDLAPAMAERGHDVRVVTRATGPAAVDFEDGVWVHRVETPFLPEGDGVASDLPVPINAFATAAVNEVRRIREWTEPDLVFAPLWDVEAIGVLRETDLPVAIHVSTPAVITGTMAGFLRNDATDPPELRRLLEVEAEVMQTADLFQANTDAVMETIRGNYDEDCADDRWRVVNIGLRDQAATAVDTDEKAEGRRVFFVGRFESRKGIDTLLAAMERIVPSYPDLVLTLAGEDRPLAPGLPLAGASWLEEHRDQPWIDRVTMLGVIDDDALHDEYSRADVVVLPSRYESFGLVMAEAMMHGKPLVSTDTSGVREVVRNGVDGLLVEPGDVDQLERAIRRMLDDPDDAARLGRAARERFVSYLSSEPLTERFEQFFRGLRVGATRADDGTSRGMLCEREAATIDLTGRAAATVILQARERACVRIVDQRERAVGLEPGGQCRIRLDVTSGQAKLLVEQGTVRIERVVAVDMEPSGP